MLFGRKKQDSSSVGSDLLKFLTAASVLYEQTLAAGYMPHPEKFFSPDCYRVIVNRSTRNDGELHGTKFAKDTWTMLEDAEIKKVIRARNYSEVKTAGGYKMKVGQDYKELWQVIGSKDYKVIDVKLKED